MKSDVRRSVRYQRGAAGVERCSELAVRVEAKLTSAPSYGFRVVDWHDVARAADPVGESPLFAVYFGRLRAALAVCRANFAEFLGITPTEAPTVLVPQRIPLRPHCTQWLRVPRVHMGAVIARQEVLLVTPYENFVAGYKAREAKAQ